MTHYQKSFLLRLVDRQIDKLMDEAEEKIFAASRDITDPEFWDKEYSEIRERYVALCSARGQIQVMEVEQ